VTATAKPPRFYAAHCYCAPRLHFCLRSRLHRCAAYTGRAIASTSALARVRVVGLGAIARFLTDPLSVDLWPSSRVTIAHACALRLLAHGSLTLGPAFEQADARDALDFDVPNQLATASLICGLVASLATLNLTWLRSTRASFLGDHRRG